MTGEQGEPCLLLQRRHPGKDTYPGLFDITAAGHLEAGENVSDGIRELKEELGTDLFFLSHYLSSPFYNFPLLRTRPPSYGPLITSLWTLNNSDPLSARDPLFKPSSKKFRLERPTTKP
ncbi:NUDIX domain-containing protein [Paenibacillus aurantius]|uniref:NUDIX domain-containing protein n=1 Tax=Paenibacillus aurantius TaxID=2918900 RepID=A0AA96LGG0_9BACL|nr:NUDIX domain-containing protein [Paenibacillus aurantius]WNQ12825.1 NUDIX domain-containing protein [Paenibacillus aurantius]